MKNIIYALFFPNDKIYIGQSNNFSNRMRSHKSSSKTHNTYLQNAIKKYGWENIQKEILLECDIKYVDFFERAFITGYNSMYKNRGYNLESGGSKNKKVSEMTKMKLSKIGKGRKLSELHKMKISESKKGNILSCKVGELNSMYGKHHSDETKEKLRSNRLGKKMSDETKLKISKKTAGKNHPSYGTHLSDEIKLRIQLSKLGTKASDETKSKLSAMRKGKNNSRYYELSDAVKNSIIQLYEDNTSICKISRINNLHRGKIIRFLTEVGKLKSKNKKEN